MDGLNLKATTKVLLTKLDENGQVVGVEEHYVDLTEEEAKSLWHSLQQD